jgi:phosphohistidine phosphatase
MNLFILRHASAGVRRANPLLDVKRPLDKEGKRHCLHLAHVLNALKINFDIVVSSPLKRAQQTAQLVATETGYEQKILISNALLPTATFAQFQRLLRECAPYENVLVVGHNPNITAFLGQLVGAPAAGADQAPDPGHARIRLRKGSLARLSLQRGPAILQGLLDPRLVRALYATSTKSSRRNTSRK